MGIFREIPPTAGFNFKFKDFILPQKISPHCLSLEEDFKFYLGIHHVQITYSGTAALYLILETLKELSAKKTVIIPAYICPLVPLAIKRAGLNIEVCDINYEDFNFNYAELESLCRNNTDILAVIPTHLAGIPVEIDKVLNIAKERSIFRQKSRHLCRFRFFQLSQRQRPDYL
jgi:dTDP-4-amino-4,6-dideoxygalactose transaminase